MQSKRPISEALTLPDAIRKFTALAAQRMGLTERGVIKTQRAYEARKAAAESGSR